MGTQIAVGQPGPAQDQEGVRSESSAPCRAHPRHSRQARAWSKQSLTPKCRRAVPHAPSSPSALSLFVPSDITHNTKSELTKYQPQ